MLTLHIANKTYSSWSLRPWLLLKMLAIPFEERLHPFSEGSSHTAFRAFSPSGRVPCLIDGDLTVWDSLAIAEHLAETHPAVWPADRAARAFARSISAEMHAGFLALRKTCSMNCALRVALHAIPEPLAADIARIEEIWTEGPARFSGPFLAGPAFTAADAFYAPVAFRVRTYGLSLSPAARAYAERLLDLEPMREWNRAALAEPWREPGHEAGIAAAGTILEDLRTTA